MVVNEKHIMSNSSGLGLESLKNLSKIPGLDFFALKTMNL